MSDANRLLCLRVALIAIGLTFIFGIYVLGIVWQGNSSKGDSSTRGKKRKKTNYRRCEIQNVPGTQLEVILHRRTGEG